MMEVLALRKHGCIIEKEANEGNSYIYPQVECQY